MQGGVLLTMKTYYEVYYKTFEGNIMDWSMNKQIR